VNVWSEGLRRLGLQTGPWLREAKRAVRQGAPDDIHISIGGDLSVPLGVLKQHALHAARGQKIAYVVDISYHDPNIEKVIALRPALHRGTLPGSGCQYCRAETTSNGAPGRGYCKASGCRPPSPISLLGPIPRTSGRAAARGRRGVLCSPITRQAILEPNADLRQQPIRKTLGFRLPDLRRHRAAG
jgi:hypothetical protein